MSQITGTILDIQRMSTEDGPGLRTTVFLKGCTLQCTWCHNPESIHAGVEIRWSETACIGCKTCIGTCEHNALAHTDTGLIIDRELCRRCGECADQCPSLAIETMGKAWNVETLVGELVKDNAFFEKSEGGITLSGGEMTLQADFCKEVLKQLQARGIHTAIDTCGQCKQEALEKLLPFADMVLFDLKEMNPEKHKVFTGRSNRTILDNVKFVADRLRSDGKKNALWIRTPVIPGATLSDENIRAMGAFIAENLGTSVGRWELCTFNNLCKDKYRSLGIPWKHDETELVTSDEINRLFQTAKISGVDMRIVHWSGSVRN